jgi:hypothetical protein
MKLIPLKIASFFLLAISFYKPLYSQDCMLLFATEICNASSYYFDINRSREMYLSPTGDGVEINKSKLKSSNFQIIERPHDSFTFIPKMLGPAKISAYVKLSNGKKTLIQREFEVVQLPSLKLELFSSNPEHNFMWLKLTDTNSGEDVSNDYQLCILDFTLTSASGEKKHEGVLHFQKAYFPSISLAEISSYFELNDQLTISMSVMHKEYMLPQIINETTFTVESLWK